MNTFRFTVSPEEVHMRVDQLLSRQTGEPREFVKVHKDSLRVNEIPTKLSYKLREGDLITWDYPERTLPLLATLTPENIPLEILFEDECLIVLNKPAGMVVHPSKGHWQGTLSNALLYHLGAQSDFQDPLRPGIVHRLDKDTSGLMIIAKNAKTQSLLAKAFKTRKILKIYTALVQGHLTALYGKIDQPIGRSPSNRLLFAVDPENGRSALSEYRVIEEYPRATLVKIRIHTGRTHQIRVHFQYLKHPIIGDPLYSRTYKALPLCLTATKIAFIHPYSLQPLEFSVPIPPAIQARIKSFQ